MIYLSVTYILTIEERAFVMPYQKSPKTGSLLGTELGPGTSGCWGNRMVSEEDVATTTTIDTEPKK